MTTSAWMSRKKATSCEIQPPRATLGVRIVRRRTWRPPRVGIARKTPRGKLSPFPARKNGRPVSGSRHLLFTVYYLLLATNHPRTYPRLPDQQQNTRMWHNHIRAAIDLHLDRVLPKE